MKKNFPNFIVVGAKRSGTTSLYYYLKSTNGIFLPERKYVTFFLGRKSDDKLNENQYLKFYSKVSNEKIIGEVNPNYLNDAESPSLIKKYIPNCKIIILLRNPIERTFSEYNSEKMKEKLNCSFHDAIKNNTNDIVTNSLYYEVIKNYIEKFGMQNVGIWLSENLNSNPKNVLHEIFNFLGISAKIPDVSKNYSTNSIPRNIFFKKILRHKKILKFLSKLLLFNNVRQKLSEFTYKPVPKSEIDNEDKIFLKNFFKNDSKNLESYLKLDLSSWS